MTDVAHRLTRTPQGVLGLALLLALLALCLFGTVLAPYPPEAMDFAGRFAAPGAKHWFGADQLGRDVLSRLLVGARSTVPLAVAATFSGAALGACLGTLSAYLGGRWDEAITRTIDAVMAVPHLLLALILVSTFGKGSLNAAVAIAIAVAPSMARVTRSVALVVRRQEYVQAAIARGESGGWIVLREMLPNVAAPVIIEATIRVAFAVMLFATLSFLGLGAQPPAASWGRMVADAQTLIAVAPRLALLPGLAIVLTVLAINLAGEAIRGRFAPETGL